MLKVNHALKYLYPYESVNEGNVNNNMKVETKYLMSFDHVSFQRFQH